MGWSSAKYRQATPGYLMALFAGNGASLLSLVETSSASDYLHACAKMVNFSVIISFQNWLRRLPRLQGSDVVPHDAEGLLETGTMSSAASSSTTPTHQHAAFQSRVSSSGAGPGSSGAVDDGDESGAYSSPGRMIDVDGTPKSVLRGAMGIPVVVRARISARNGTRTKHPQGIHPGLA